LREFEIDKQSAHALIEPSSFSADDELADPEKLWCILDYGWLSDANRSDSPFQPSPFTGGSSSGWGLFEDLIGDDIFFPTMHDFPTGMENHRHPNAQTPRNANSRGLWYNFSGGGTPTGHKPGLTPRT
jgi:hypothetical protein